MEKCNGTISNSSDIDAFDKENEILRKQNSDNGYLPEMPYCCKTSKIAEQAIWLCNFDVTKGDVPQQ